MPHSGSRARRAFTLIELLVVISIIGILAALVIVAVSAILGKGPELVATNDIQQMTMAINNFKQKHGVYPPSRIVLSANPARMDPVSLAYVSAIWPRIDFNNPASPIDWAGKNNSYAQLKNISYTLEGDQCLVFFLGGIPDSLLPDRKGCFGFSANPLNPTDRSDIGKGTREVSFQFQSNRLFIRQRFDPVPFYSYADPYFPYSNSNIPLRPYAYFSSGKSQNGYNVGDCATLLPGGPYYDSTTNPHRYFNPTTFQIISAGKNGLYGPGGPWLPAAAAAIGTAGEDDQVNFHDALLGVPQ